MIFFLLSKQPTAPSSIGGDGETVSMVKKW